MSRALFTDILRPSINKIESMVVTYANEICTGPGHSDFNRAK